MKESTHGNKTLRIKPLVACLAFALAAATTGTELSAALPASSTATVQRHSIHRTGANFQRIEREHLKQGWARAHDKERPAGLPRPAGTVAVTSCADDGSAGTLRSVVAGAVDGDVVDLSALTCSTITLTQGGISIDVDNLGVVGPGSKALTIDADNAGTAFDLYGTEDGGYGTLAISGVTITNGYSEFSGGAIWAGNHSNVELDDVAVTNSLSHAKYASGGGVFASGSVTLSNSTIANNTAISTKYDGVGGGVYAAGDLTILNSTVSGNTAKADASYTYGGTVYDGVGLGGGVGAVGATSISNSTISGNSATIGGGVFAMSLASLQNSTVTLNVASADNSSYASMAEGGGVAVNSSAGTATINSAILFGNSGGGSYYGADLGGLSQVIGSNNLIGESSSPVPADTLTDDPVLLPLADNGGPTLTHALGQGSPAIDAGSNPDGLKTDQRGEGYARVSGPAADIGAFEVQGGEDDTIFADGFDGPGAD